MKVLTLLPCALLSLLKPLAAEAPKPIAYLPEGELVKAATIVVVPPAELDKYVAIVEKAAVEDPEWFAEHSKKAAPGVPLPYDPKLGLTEEQYKAYLELWSKRDFKSVDPVIVQLKEESDGRWTINASMPGRGSTPISTLKYDPEDDVFVSPNGTLVRLEDVEADANSILGEWSGHEWRFQDDNAFGKTKENFAMGKTGDGKYGLLVYRMQEVSTAGTRLYDKSLVIRFQMGEEGILKLPPPGEEP